MDCQLQNLPEAGDELSRGERLRLQACRGLRYVGRNTRRVVSEPRLLLEKAHLVKRQERPGFRGAKGGEPGAGDTGGILACGRSAYGRGRRARGG
jgi:hypothetical protein